MQSLPIDSVLEAIAAAVREHGAVVVEAEPGAGKTTRVPAALLERGVFGKGRVVVTEPRRLAARLAARFVADEMGSRVGDRVGYSVRFEHVASPATRLLYVTEGVLVRRLLEDPVLADVSAVVVDEVHERHLETDLVLALVRRLRAGPRSDLGLVVMSATLDAERFATFVNAPAVRSHGRAYPLTVEHLPAPDDRPLERQVASAVRRALGEADEGNVLVFLPGAGEIRRARERLADVEAQGVDVLPLHGDLSIAEQARAVSPGGRRKVILSTNVAESSVTVAGVNVVIDSGLARTVTHSPWSGLGHLEVTPVSRASATQRAGRAGRLGPGRVLRLYTRGDLEGRPAQDIAEIARADLAETVLLLHGVGVADPATLAWVDAPPDSALVAAEALLRGLGAVAPDGTLTNAGRRMLRLPLPPRLARLVTAGEDAGVGHEACLAASLLAERDIRVDARTQFGNARSPLDAPTGPSDVLELMDRFREAEDDGLSGDRLRRLGLDERAVRAVVTSRDRLDRGIDDGAERPKDLEAVDRALQRALLAAYPDRVARRRSPGERGLILASGATAELAEGSVVRDATFLVALDAETRRGGTTAVRLASAIEPDWLLEDHADLVEATDELVWNGERRRVERVSRLRLGSVVLDEDRGPAAPSPEVARMLARAARDAGLTRDERIVALGLRLALLAEHMPELGAVRPSDEDIEGALAAAAQGVISLEQVRVEQILTELDARLSPAQRAALHQDVPDRLIVGQGRHVPVHYEADRPPWIESRLQDFFGSTAGPRLCRGRLPLTLHLLAPNHRAVQVTQDLAGFWERHYAAIRRELSRRYPKHSWPEDPIAARPPLKR